MTWMFRSTFSERSTPGSPKVRTTSRLWFGETIDSNGSRKVEQTLDLHRRRVLREGLDELAELPSVGEELLAPIGLERLPGLHELEQEPGLLPPLRLGQADLGESGRERRVELRRNGHGASHPAENRPHGSALGLGLRVVLAEVVDEKASRRSAGSSRLGRPPAVPEAAP